MSDGQDIKSITSGGGNPLLTQYILWLDTFLRNELLAKGEKTKPTQPYGSLQSYWDTANNMARAGSWGMGLPFINEFLSDYKTYQSAFPEQKPTAKSYAIIPDPSGYDVLVGYSEEDNKGDIVSYDIVGRTQAGGTQGMAGMEGITPYQQAQLGLQQQQLEQTKDQPNSLGDPKDEGKGWFNAPSQAYLLLQSAKDAIARGESLLLLPYYTDFLKQYQTIYPTQKPTATKFAITQDPS